MVPAAFPGGSELNLEHDKEGTCPRGQGWPQPPVRVSMAMTWGEGQQGPQRRAREGRHTPGLSPGLCWASDGLAGECPEDQREARSWEHWAPWGWEARWDSRVTWPSAQVDGAQSGHRIAG